MIRSRLLFLLLLLAYLGLTPVGVYTCACFVPGEPALPASAGWGDFSEQAPSPHTAVANFLTYISLSFLVAVALKWIIHFQSYHFCRYPSWDIVLFSEPPPTPPPHFA